MHEFPLIDDMHDQNVGLEVQKPHDSQSRGKRGCTRVKVFPNLDISDVRETLRTKSATFIVARYRFLVPLLIVLCVKLVSSLFVYYFLNMGSSDTYWMTVSWDTEGQNTNMRTVAQQGLRWPYMFLGWDSAWYLSIVMKGYAFSGKSFAFFPGYPSLSWIVNLVLSNPAVSIILLSFIPGILSIPVYQLVMEKYFDNLKALRLTLLYAFFPYVFLFTTVAYGEGLFLLFTMASWYFLKERKIGHAASLASLSTLVRAPGAAMAFPIGLEAYNERKIDANRSRWLLFLALAPLITYSSWLLYCRLTFNSWLPTGWSGMYSFRTLIFDVLPQNGFQPLLEYFKVWPLSPLFIVFVLMTPFLILALILVLFKMDKSLFVYSTAYFVGVLMGGALASIPRFLSFLFPIWLPLTVKLVESKRPNLLTLITCACFLTVGIIFWILFINGIFVA